MTYTDLTQNLNAMNLLWAFDLKPDIDTNGNPIPMDTFAYTKVGIFLNN
jgi:hypothetical protein